MCCRPALWLSAEGVLSPAGGGGLGSVPVPKCALVQATCPLCLAVLPAKQEARCCRPPESSPRSSSAMGKTQREEDAGVCLWGAVPGCPWRGQRAAGRGRPSASSTQGPQRAHCMGKVLLGQPGSRAGSRGLQTQFVARTPVQLGVLI